MGTTEQVTTPDVDADRDRGNGERATWYRTGAKAAFGAFVAVGLTSLVVYALQFGWSGKTVSVLAVGVVVGAAAFLVGGLLGFLFGIPRTREDEVAADADAPEARVSYRVNTNLVQISDWLTKILVGVGLIQIRELSGALQQLGDELAPALGDHPSSNVFGIAVIVYFVVGGFLVGYLWTRLLLSIAFKFADQTDIEQRLTKVEQKSGDIERRVDEQQERDARALNIFERQINPHSSGAPRIEPHTIVDAFNGASPPVRLYVFLRARDRRRDTWDSDKEAMERTLPIFRALIECGGGDRADHRFHGQLGYGLRDMRTPDLAGAELALTTAIARRDEANEAGYLLYELNRADCRVAMGRPHDEVLADLRVVVRDDWVRERMRDYTRVDQWLTANGVTDDILMGAG